MERKETIAVKKLLTVMSVGTYRMLAMRGVLCIAQRATYTLVERASVPEKYLSLLACAHRTSSPGCSH